MKVLFAAGGTGGHINPALAAAGMVRERHPEAQILFVGTAEKMEARLVPAAGYDFKTIDISGFQRRLTLENIKRNSAHFQTAQILRAGQKNSARFSAGCGGGLWRLCQRAGAAHGGKARLSNRDS